MAGSTAVDSFSIDTDSEPFSDVDSGFGASTIGNSSNGVNTTSTDLFSYTYENGRRYHSYREGIYMLPNDDREIERLDLYHHIFKLLISGELHLSPLRSGAKRILDIGTGTGSWAIDMAEKFPDVEVIGNDLSKIQPPWVPPNCKFEVDDVESDWTCPKNHFDLIHARSMCGSLLDWDLFLKRSYEHTTPGGYFEFHDYDGQLASNTGVVPTTDNSALAKWWSLVIDTSVKCGRPFKIAATMKEMIEKAGFVDVIERVERWPLGAWPDDPAQKEIGRWGKVGICESLHAFAAALLTRILGWREEDVKDLCERALAEIQNNDIELQYYANAYFIYGRKPEINEKVSQ